MRKFRTLAQKLVSQEEDATMGEYGLMVALIAVVCIAGVAFWGTNILVIFNLIAASV